MENEADAEKLFAAYLRSNDCFKLKARLMKVSRYRLPNDTVITQTTEQDNSVATAECDLTIDDLPNDVLVYIFTRFPPRNLYVLEKGTKLTLKNTLFIHNIYLFFKCISL